MNNLNDSNLSDRLKARDGLAANSTIDKAMGVAGEVFKLIEMHRTPPVPKTYEVWYSYAAEQDDVLCEHINVIVENGGSLGPYDIDQIHQEYLSSGEALRDKEERTNEALDSELDAILNLVKAYLASTRSYSGSLSDTLEKLPDGAKPAQIRKTIELLIAENENMRNEADSLSLSLEQSQTQIKEMRSSLAEAKEREMRDPLTGLANRRRFEMALNREVGQAHASGSTMCLVLGDIDHFKNVNDTFGHLIGDSVIKYVASLLTKNVKGRDAVARYGGEEYAVILPQTKIADAKILTEQIRVQLETTKLVVTETNTSIGEITASFGIAQLHEGDSPQRLIQRADNMLHEAKNAGRNRTVCEDAPRSC